MRADHRRCEKEHRLWSPDHRVWSGMFERDEGLPLPDSLPDSRLFVVPEALMELVPPPSPRFAAVTAALAAFTGSDWASFRKQLVAFAFSRCRRHDEAQDLAQEAMRRLIEPTTTWDPAAEDAASFARTVITSRLANERTSAEARTTIPLDPSGKKEPPDESLHPPDPRALTEDRFAELDLSARRLAFVRNRLTLDAKALEMLAFTIAGDDAPADIRAKTGYSDEVIAAARKRLDRALEAAVRAIPDDPPSTPDAGDESEADSQEVA
jgi:DNA-directed RNA polymerase specialized sigma24 family protein